MFLDRDGVLNEDRDDYVKCIAEVNVFPGAGNALKRLRDAGYLCILVTNQSPIGRGIFTHEHLARMHDYLAQRLSEEGGELDDIFYCPHRPDENCSCRKPRPGMLLEAITRHGIDASSSFMVGDRVGDIAAGKAAGVRAIRITSHASWPLENNPTAECNTSDLPKAANYILNQVITCVT